jgi:hypothetical protein
MISHNARHVELPRPANLLMFSGGKQEPHTMGVDKVQGMNQAVGE